MPIWMNRHPFGWLRVAFSSSLQLLGELATTHIKGEFFANTKHA
jgi:hypothetical protein